MPAERTKELIHIGDRANIGYSTHARDRIHIEPNLKVRLCSPIEPMDYAGGIERMKKFACVVGTTVITEHERGDAESAMIGYPFEEIGFFLFNRRDNADARSPARLLWSIVYRLLLHDVGE